MTANEIGQVIGGLITSVFGLLFILGIFITLFAWPVLVISAVRSLRRIATALERLADAPVPATRHEPEVGPWKTVTDAARSGSSSAEPSR